MRGDIKKNSKWEDGFENPVFVPICFRVKLKGSR